MASIRNSKKLLNKTVNRLLEEAYDLQLKMPSIKEKSEAAIDQIVAFYDTYIAKLKDAKSKKDLKSFKQVVEQKGNDFFQDLINLQP
jgi:ACT domain-containing protein